MSTVRILVADDHEVVRRGVRALLESQPGWQIVGEAVNGREAVQQAEGLKPDVVILDITMPELTGIEATRRILKAVPQTEVLILTMHDSEKLAQRIVEAGARGYVSKSDIGASLINAVDAVRRHQVFLTASAATAIVDTYLERATDKQRKKSPTQLTSREYEVLQLIASGKSNKEVASLLGISLYTAETHRRNIMQKLNFHSVTQLTRFAIRNQIVSA